MSYVQRSKNYTSGMLQSWNKFCFTGGVLEMSVQLPGGSANASGLWPAAWLMGNLARATFPTTTTNVWPWSYSTCGEISDLDQKQKINACDSATFEDSYGMNPKQGRGAPEIDIFEVMMGHEMPTIPAGVDPSTVNPPFDYYHVKAFMSTSLQVAPGIASRRPHNGVPLSLNRSAVWYSDLHLSHRTSINSAFYGAAAGITGMSYMEDAISANTLLEDENFMEPHKYRLEWQPGPHGYLHWYLDSDYLFGIEASALQEATGAIIPEEPSYIILNTAVSHVWGFPEPCDGIDKPTCSACWECYDCTNPECQCSLPEAMRGCANLPAVMKIDYIRLYQDLKDPSRSVGCSPSSHPTEKYISAFPASYQDWSPATSARLHRYSALVIIVHALVLLILLLALIYSCRYLCNPRYRMIGDVRSVPTSATDSPKRRSSKSAIGNSDTKRVNTFELKKTTYKGDIYNKSETTGLLSSSNPP